MGVIKDYVRTALNGVSLYTKNLETKLRKEFDTKLKEFNTKLSDKVDVADIVPPVQADWNNVDEDSVAHILNRPFYDDIAHKTYTFENVSISGQYTCTIGYIDGEFVEGESYVVTVNGTEYNFTATNETSISDGSRNILLAVYDGKFQLHAFTWWSSGATVSISGPIHILKKLDGKFIDGVTSLNGEIGDVIIDRDKLSAAPIDYDQRFFYNLSGESRVEAWFDWIGDGTEHGTGLICGDTHIFNKYDGDTPILCIFNSATTGTGQNYYRYDSILRGIELPKKANDAASKLYVDTHIPTDDHINSLIDTKLDNFEVPDSGAATMQPLTFTGAVNATYDGSEAVSVEIPVGGGGDWEVLMDTTLEADSQIVINNLDAVTELSMAVAVPASPDDSEDAFSSAQNVLGIHFNTIPVKKSGKGVVIHLHVWKTGDIAYGLLQGGYTTATTPKFNTSLASGSLLRRIAMAETDKSKIYLARAFPVGTAIYIAVKRG